MIALEKGLEEKEVMFHKNGHRKVLYVIWNSIYI